VAVMNNQYNNDLLNAALRNLLLESFILDFVYFIIACIIFSAYPSITLIPTIIALLSVCVLSHILITAKADSHCFIKIYGFYEDKEYVIKQFDHETMKKNVKTVIDERNGDGAILTSSFLALASHTLMSNRPSPEVRYNMSIVPLKAVTQVICGTRLVMKNNRFSINGPTYYAEYCLYTVYYKQGDAASEFQFLFESPLIGGYVLSALRLYGIKTVDIKTATVPEEMHQVL